VANLVREYRPEILLLPATSLGSDLAPRLAQDLDTGLISNCVQLGLDMSERLLLGTYAIYNGEMLRTVCCPKGRPQIATLKPGQFRLPYEDAYRSGEVIAVEVDPIDDGQLDWELKDAALDLPPLPLSEARVVVAAGRGMGDAGGFQLVKDLASALGGVVAGSRGAFDAGWITEEQIVGVAGQTVAPDLYVACGLTGDVFHYFGLQDAKYIVAINSDPGAPIMARANMALVGDAREIIPAMLEALAS
jgi:electron transfer flavoprotein alpha subunit